ncbi:hypothetical protein IPM62_01190 [Candidatus Woesebacteria bacterium]|nr:MAG: hypothetical protein IPM62_01190 [Candidatus Woesebacteria bacterium]
MDSEHVFLTPDGELVTMRMKDAPSFRSLSEEESKRRNRGELDYDYVIFDPGKL